ncbi:Hypothetical protein SRAE_2000300800 [Strongyloides ratti]|uniref:Uncharacterized protein n=1 Tax=Strongyloides ratti TaxID=34506 RepID=A0A090LLD4_STRRB|nr:Hypothetical protein SRAE_2000300800 [Strongyloides ratti]CEF68350.1 Hypothetical protein SRAE_2000300800 [Strongyloides ratti]
MAFLTSDQHWNNLAEKNKKSLFMEESDFALINIIPGEFPQYAGDCPNVLRQVADINDISNIPNDDINKINNDKKNSALENEIVYIKKLRQELFINMIKLEILETKLYILEEVVLLSKTITSPSSSIKDSLNVASSIDDNKMRGKYSSILYEFSVNVCVVVT